MTFRTEEKILFRSSEQSVFIDEVFKNKNVQKLYGDRIINSLYFDNTSFQMHCESEEGLVPRKKLRYRIYGYDKIFSYSGRVNREIKVSSVEGRYKKQSEITIDCSQHKIIEFMPEYGTLFPVCIVKYCRSYFKCDGIRFTFDRNITYKEINSNIIYHEPYTVLEIKSPYGYDLTQLDSLAMEGRRSRFSKYSNAVNCFHGAFKV